MLGLLGDPDGSTFVARPAIVAEIHSVSPASGVSPGSSSTLGGVPVFHTITLPPGLHFPEYTTPMYPSRCASESACARISVFGAEMRTSSPCRSGVPVPFISGLAVTTPEDAMHAP